MGCTMNIKKREIPASKPTWARLNPILSIKTGNRGLMKEL
jgi:hypothetical protein